MAPGGHHWACPSSAGITPSSGSVHLSTPTAQSDNGNSQPSSLCEPVHRKLTASGKVCTPILLYICTLPTWLGCKPTTSCHDLGRPLGPSKRQPPPDPAHLLPGYRHLKGSQRQMGSRNRKEGHLHCGANSEVRIQQAVMPNDVHTLSLRSVPMSKAVRRAYVKDCPAPSMLTIRGSWTRAL